jgi:hypothetical protein
MIIIPLTKQIKDEARRLSDEVIKNLPPTANYTHISARDRFYIGYLGELAFAELVKGKKVTHNINTSGSSQDEDFYAYCKTVDKKIDIKSTNHPNGRYIMIPKKQFDKNKATIYVGIKLTDDEAEIWGWCFSSSLELKEEGFIENNPQPVYYKELSKLNDLGVLLSNIIDK